MKLSSHAAGLLLLSIAAGGVNAAPILWSLPPVALQGCCIPPLNEQKAEVSGTFVFDWQTLTYSGWEFTISGYTAPVAPLNGTLTPATSTILTSSPAFLHLVYASNQADLVLTFAFVTFGGLIEVPLPPFGGEAPVLVSNSARFVSFSAFSSGAVSSVPEPVAGVLVLVGGAILCMSKPGWFRRGTRKL
jgi:hypothetical protein